MTAEGIEEMLLFVSGGELCLCLASPALKDKPLNRSEENL